MVGITLTYLNMYIVCSVRSFLSVSVFFLAETQDKQSQKRENIGNTWVG